MTRRFAALAAWTLVWCVPALLAGGCAPTPAQTATPTPAPTPDAAGIALRDVTRESGLDYRFVIAGRRPLTILQSIGNGCAFLDYDRDGNRDILLVGSDAPKLYRGDGKGHFADVTAATNFLPKLPDTPGAAWLGCAVGDVDNDGFPEVYLSGFRTAALLHNVGGKRFEDVTQEAGLKAQPWGTSCGFADLDGDGRLDLFVGNYVQFSTDPKKHRQLCNLGAWTGCGPLVYEPEKPTLYRNEGGLRFRDISESSGIRTSAGKNLGVAFADADGDGKTDILLANDETAGDLFRNRGGMRFANDGTASGTAFAPDGRAHGGMGADWGDFDNDGKLDAIVATFEHEPKSLYHNEGEGVYKDVTNPSGLGAATALWVAFGVKWADFDNDGFLDLVIANGHVYDNAGELRLGRGSGKYRQPVQVFRNRDGRTFDDITAALPDLAERQIVGRGLAVGDYDNDGRIDCLIVDSEGAPLLLHNESRARDWIGFQMTGGKGMNRDAYGAMVTVTTQGRNRIRHCHTDGSYLSASDPRVLFGIGDATGQVSVSVRWPDGKNDDWTGVPIGRYWTLTPGEPPR